MDAQQLLYRASRWPWRWTKFAREAATLCDREVTKFNVLNEEHRLLKLEAAEYQKQRVADAERHQQLRDDFQLLKLEASELQKREKLLSMELEAMWEERKTILTKHDQMKEGVTTLFEFIRRNKSTDDKGYEIPQLSQFPNIFRK